MTGFRLIYAPTIIPAYLYLLTGSAAAVGLGTALLQLGGTVSPILSGAQVESRKRILPYAITVGSMMRVMVQIMTLGETSACSQEQPSGVSTSGLDCSKCTTVRFFEI